MYLGGVTFDPKNGTLGLPYYAMQHFTDQVQSSAFEEERRQYCLPVLDPHIIRCTEEPFLPPQGDTIESENGLIKYEQLEFLKNSTLIIDNTMYAIYVPYNITSDQTKYRIGDQAAGTMLVRMNWAAATTYNTTVITTSDNSTGGGYASDLYNLMYGGPPDAGTLSKNSNGTKFFAAKCEMASIKYRDNYLSSWRKVDFTLKNGVSRANVTEERCPNPKGKPHSSCV
jgi:hypothetical protein